LNECKTVRITAIATYDMAPALREFAETLYSLRNDARHEGNRRLAKYIKTLLVCLPGKFGQKLRRWQISDDQTCPGPWQRWYKTDNQGRMGARRSVSWIVEEQVDAGLGYESVPAIAAWVNSWGRRILWEWMKNVGREKIYYCDTDSIWVRGDDSECYQLPSVNTSDKLGAIRLVDRYSETEIRGLKHYTVDGKLSPRPASDMPGLWSQLDCNGSDGQWISGATISGTSPQLGRKRVPNASIKPYAHGRVLRDGTVLPLVLEEW